MSERGNGNSDVEGISDLDVSRRHLLRLAGAGAVSDVRSAIAQDMSNGADSFYVSDEVVLEKVRFKSQYQMEIAGNLFIPKNLDQNTKKPAILVGHPMGAVKEQSANLYATKMAERGFVAVSFDLPYWGESDGHPRNMVSPDAYAEGFSAVVVCLGMQFWL